MARPVPKFHGFVGHKGIVEQLCQQLIGAKARGEPFPPTLFTGPSGVGKTLLAQSLADEYGTSMKMIHGNTTAAEISSLLQQTKAADFVFMDECHNLTAKSQELLYQVIDEQRVPATEHGVKSAEAEYIEIPPVSLILATDQPGKLLNALEKRMELMIRLDYYNQREMKEIVERIATDLNLLISPQAANSLARVSWGIPRKAKHHLRNLRRHFLDAEDRQIGTADVQGFLKAFGIDALGLDKTERLYLRFLARTKKASLESLTSHLGSDSEYVRRQIEPILKRAGLIVIGSGGRQLTDKGREYIRRKTRT